MPVKNYPAESSEEELVQPIKSSKSKLAVPKSKPKRKKSVTTMEDDIAGLISQKNQYRTKTDYSTEQVSENDADMQRKLT